MITFIKKTFDFLRIIVIIYIENLKKPHGEETIMTNMTVKKERKGKERAYYI